MWIKLLRYSIALLSVLLLKCVGPGGIAEIPSSVPSSPFPRLNPYFSETPPLEPSQYTDPDFPGILRREPEALGIFLNFFNQSNSCYKSAAFQVVATQVRRQGGHAYLDRFKQEKLRPEQIFSSSQPSCQALLASADTFQKQVVTQTLQVFQGLKLLLVSLLEKHQSIYEYIQGLGGVTVQKTAISAKDRQWLENQHQALIKLSREFREQETEMTKRKTFIESTFNCTLNWKDSFSDGSPQDSSLYYSFLRFLKLLPVSTTFPLSSGGDTFQKSYQETLNEGKIVEAVFGRPFLFLTAERFLNIPRNLRGFFTTGFFSGIVRTGVKPLCQRSLGKPCELVSVSVHIPGHWYALVSFEQPRSGPVWVLLDDCRTHVEMWSPQEPWDEVTGGMRKMVGDLLYY